MADLTPHQKIELAGKLISVVDDYLVKHELPAYEGNDALLIAFFTRANADELARCLTLCTG